MIGGYLSCYFEKKKLSPYLQEKQGFPALTASACKQECHIVLNLIGIFKKEIIIRSWFIYMICILCNNFKHTLYITSIAILTFML